jgi:hypothetical protein
LTPPAASALALRSGPPTRRTDGGELLLGEGEAEGALGAGVEGEPGGPGAAELAAWLLQEIPADPDNHL